MVLITILALAVLAFVGKLIYDVQKNKKQTPTKTIDDFEFKDDFQKLAGITPMNPNDEIREILVKNNLNSKERIIEEMMKAAQNSDFPKQDETINMGTTKIGAINTNFGDNDPLATIPMSRVSVEGKKKMAQIAKEDIKINTEAISKEIIDKGLYTISTKKKSNPKQMDGIKSDATFVKTRKKSTKPKA